MLFSQIVMKIDLIFSQELQKLKFNSFQLEKKKKTPHILSPCHINPCQKWSQNNVKNRNL
jgi:hypothetical protein